MRRMIWLDRIFGLIRSVSARPSSARMAAPAARTSAWSGEWISSRPKNRSMICMPGLTEVDLSAMSVRRLISMPGETSMYSEASPGRGRKPCATVPRNAAYCAWRLSRKTYARRAITATGTTLSRQDLHPGRRPDPGRPRGDHLLDIGPRPDPARGLDAHPRPDGLAHE